MPFNLQFTILKERPYHLLAITGFVLGIVALLPLNINNGTLDINLHDTYFVIAHTHLLAMLGIVLLFLWVLYLISQKIIGSKVLTWFHIIVTILSTIIFLLIVLYHPEPSRYYAFTDESSSFDWITAIMVVVLCFALAQLSLVVNLVGGSIRYLSIE